MARDQSLASREARYALREGGRPLSGLLELHQGVAIWPMTLGQYIYRDRHRVRVRAYRKCVGAMALACGPVYE